ncbi:hypothetical protein ACQ4LE_001951 [Meloidogyne hapla]|uniref:FTH domain-containing protein n=1 Tax=Meloidogyne hapla TaxID=6305 RepID=A0A1I8BRL2_MELHA
MPQLLPIDNLQQSNRQFCNLIKDYSDELAKKEFYSMELKTSYVCKQVDHGQLPLDFKLNAELKLKWEAAIQERTQMFFSVPYQSRDFDIRYSDYGLNETANLLLIPKEQDNTGPLCLKLQRYPKTIEDMLVLRYWFEQLSNCFIENVKIDQCAINPKMIALLFEGSPALKLHAECLYIYDKDFLYDGVEYLCHFVVYGSRGIHVDIDSWYRSGFRLRGGMIEEEKRFYQRELEKGHEVEPKFRNVVEYEFFDVDDLEVHFMIYLLFSVDSKKYLGGEVIDLYGD